MLKFLHILFHPESDAGITFDNMTAESPDTSGDGDTGGESSSEGNPDPDPDPDNTQTSSSEEGEADPDKVDPDKGDPDPAKTIEKALKLGENSYELKKLLEDETALGELQKLMDDGVLMRSDYSKKTEEAATLKKELTGYKEKVDADYDDGVARIREYMDKTNATMLETPLEFLRQTFSLGEKGETLEPEAIEQKIGAWIKTLTRHINDGSSYDPAALRRTADMEKRLRAMESEKETNSRTEEKTKNDEAIVGLRGNIDKRITESIDKFALTKGIMKEFPDYAEFLKGKIVSAFGKSFQEEFKKADSNWTDDNFIEKFNYEATVGAEVKKLEDFMDNKYASYVEKKRTDKSKKTTADGAGKPGKKSTSAPEGGWTFDNM